MSYKSSRFYGFMRKDAIFRMKEATLTHSLVYAMADVRFTHL